MKTQKIIMLLLLTAVMFMSVESASADVFWVNGTLRQTSNGALIVGAIVVNSTNATQYDTTGADGFFNISGFYNATGIILTANASGYTSANSRSYSTTGVSQGSNNTDLNGTGFNLSAITPVNSAEAATSVTKDAATIAWTVTATDSVNNNYVSNKIVYWASGIANTTSSWSNTSTSPSFSLTNLRPGQAYTVYTMTYNQVNNSYKDTDTVTFTTLKAGTHSYVTPTPVKTGAPILPKKTILQQIVSPGKSKVIIVLAAGLLIFVVYYFYMRKK